MNNLELPKKWGEISYPQWEELQEISSKFSGSDLEKICEEISLLLGISPDDEWFETVTLRTLSDMKKECNWIWNPKPQHPRKSIEIEGETFHLKNLENVTFGEWVDMDEFLKLPKGRLSVSAAFLYRKENEEYNYSPFKRADKFNFLPIPELLGCDSLVINYRNQIVESYSNSNIFEAPGWDEIEGEDQLPPEEVAQIKKEIEAEKKKAPFSWLAIAWGLCGNDITKLDGVFKTPIILIFNVLAMKKTLKV